VFGIVTHVHKISGTDLLKVYHLRFLTIFRKSERCGVVSLVWTVQIISGNNSGLRRPVNEHFMLLNFALNFF
jgi:hypothetical protein